jgi:hypothetical protein
MNGSSLVVKYGITDGDQVGWFAEADTLKRAAALIPKRQGVRDRHRERHTTRTHPLPKRPPSLRDITDEQLKRVATVPKREFMRRGINQHTLEKICRKEPVRALKLAKCLKGAGRIRGA